MSFSFQCDHEMALAVMQEQHLAHWGINIMSLEKTEKTMTELQINLNMSYEFDKLTESGANLQPLSGPGYAMPCVGHPACMHQPCMLIMMPLLHPMLEWRWTCQHDM